MNERDKIKFLQYAMNKGDRLKDDADRHLRLLIRSYPLDAQDLIYTYKAVLLSDFFEQIMHDLQKYLGI